MQTVKVTAGNCKIRSLQPNVIILSNKMMNQILPNLNTVYIIYPNSKKSPTSGSKSKLIWRGIILLRLSTVIEYIKLTSICQSICLYYVVDCYVSNKEFLHN